MCGLYRVCKGCYEITANTVTSDPSYCPELYLCHYFKEKKNKLISVFTFEHEISIADLRAAYEQLVQQLSVDTIILVDGGTDSLMRGDEEGLGTPAEDITSIAAVYSLDPNIAPNRYLYAIGFGIDSFHGVHHSQFLENVSKIIKNHQNSYLGCFSVVRESVEFALFKEAVSVTSIQLTHNQIFYCHSPTTCLQRWFRPQAS